MQEALRRCLQIVKRRFPPVRALVDFRTRGIGCGGECLYSRVKGEHVNEDYRRRARK